MGEFNDVRDEFAQKAESRWTGFTRFVKGNKVLVAVAVVAFGLALGALNGLF